MESMIGYVFCRANHVQQQRGRAAHDRTLGTTVGRIWWQIYEKM
jgi:hypothetical protein